MAAGAWMASAESGEAVELSDVVFDPDDVALPSAEDLTFDALYDEIVDYLEADQPVKLKIPKFLSVGDFTMEQGSIEIDIGGEKITIVGPVSVDTANVAPKTLDLTLSFDWDETADDLIPDGKPLITVDADFSSGPGVPADLTIGEAVNLINDFTGTSLDDEGLSPETGISEAGFALGYDTEDGATTLDLEAEFRLDGQPSDPDADDVVVGVLLSMTDPAGSTEGSLLTGLKLRDDDAFDDVVTLRQVFQGFPGIAAFASQVELPEVTMSMVTPTDAVVKKTCLPAETNCVALRARPLSFFGSLASKLPDDFAPDNTLTLNAAWRLDSLGDEVQQAFGYADSESVLLTGQLGFDVTDLTEFDFSLNGVSLQADLPDVSPDAQALLPDWLELSDVVFRVDYDDDAALPSITFEADATAGVSIPEQGIDLAVDVEAQIAVDDTAASIAVRAEPTAGATGWNDVFGLTWLDLTSVGLEVTIIAPDGGPVDVSGAVTSSFELAGQPFSVRLEVELIPELAAEITVSFDGSVSVFQVLGQIGVPTAGIPSEFDASLSDVSVTAHIDDGPLRLSVGAQGNVPLLGPAEGQFLFSLRGDQVLFGARSASAQPLDTILPGTPFGTLEVPTIGVVGTTAAIDDNSFNLSPEEDDFFRGFNGCAVAPAPCTGYTVELTEGIHVLASFGVPDSLSALRDILPLFWIDPSSQLLLDASAPLPGSGQSIDLTSVSLRLVLPAIVPPAPAPGDEDASKAYPDWFERARLSFRFDSTGVAVVGELGIRLRDGSVEPSSAASNGACIRSWVPVYPGADERACYDLLDFEVSAGINLSPTGPPSLVLGGALLTEPGVGWPQPFGLDFLRIDAARIQLGLAPTLTGGLQIDLGFLAAGALYDKDFSGSIALGLNVQPAPPPVFATVVPTFNGIRVSSQAGIELADFVDLYGYVVETAEDLGLPAIAPDLSSLPNISFRNLELMIGFGSFPKLCIEPGIKLGGTFHIDAPPLTVAPPAPPGGCNDDLPAAADPSVCAADPNCFASAALVATISDGIVVSGSLGPFDVGFFTCEQSLLDFRLTPTAQVLRVNAGCEIPTLLEGELDIYVGLDGVAFRGDVEIFPDADGGAFRALVEGEAELDAAQIDLANPASLLALDFDLHVVLGTDFDGLIRQQLAPIVDSLRITAATVDDVYDRLLTSGDPLAVVLEVPEIVAANGGDVPPWLLDFAGALEDFHATLDQYGLAPPSINDALGGFDVVITEGVLGYYEPETRECQKDIDVLGFQVGTGELGTVIDGVCWDDPPGGFLNLSELGTWVDPSCRSALDLPGVVIDGVCWAIPPIEVHIPGLSELFPGIPGSFAELVEGVEGAIAPLLEDYPGVPDDLALSTLLAKLADGLAGVGSPVDIECVDFRLDSVEGSTEQIAALRFAAHLFGAEVGMAADWDFNAGPVPQAVELIDQLLAVVFGTSPVPACEPIGTTTFGGGSGAPVNGLGGDGVEPDLTGFSIELDTDEVTEGIAVTLGGTFAAASPDDRTVTIDWGDGTATTTRTVVANATDFTASHTYVDDDPTGTARDVYTVTATAGAVTESVLVDVVNAAPTGLTVDVADVDEGSTATLAGSFTDAGDDDTHTVRITWGDGGAPQVVSLPAGARTFSVPHAYIDDDPTGTAADGYPISVRLVDDDAGRADAATSVTVRNVAPSNVTLTPRVAITEGLLVTYDLSFDDPGTRDPHTLTIDWADGSALQTIPLAAGVGVDAPLAISHRFLDDNPTATASDTAAVTVTVLDDDAGSSGVVATNQTVRDVAPTVQLEVRTGEIDEGQTATLVGSIIDPGVLDTFTLTIDWDVADTTDTDVVDTVVTLPAGTTSFTAEVAYGDNGTFGVSATVVDDDTLVGTGSGTVVVDNVDPNVVIDETGAMSPAPPSGIVTFLVRAGTALSLQAAADDPGSDDLSFGWDFDLRTTGQLDAGTASTTSLVNPPANDPASSPTVQPRDDVGSAVSKTWTRACLYQVGVTATDDDAGSHSDSTWVVVTGTESRVRNSGWWYNEYGPKRKATLDATTLECYRQVVVHLSSVFGPGEYRALAAFTSVQDALNTKQTANSSELLVRPLAATWLNVAHGALRWDQLVDTDGAGGNDTPLSQVLATAEAVRNNPGSTRAQLLAQEAILDRINS